MFVKKENRGGIFHVTLNRPEKHNSFHPDMIRELTRVFIDVEQSEDVSAVYLSGEGKSFCSGADLSWMQSMVSYNFEENFEDSQQLFKMFESIFNCSLPIIGKAHGYVMGGALGLLAVCDVVVAVNSTQFGFTEVNLGLAPAVISPFVLKKMNFNKASELMLSGKIFSSNEALESQLVNFVGGDVEVEEYLGKLFQQFKKVDTGAVRETKKLIQKINQKEVLSDFVKEKTCKVIAERRISDSAQKKLREFLEKRKS